jgi:hypothetical protein
MRMGLVAALLAALVPACGQAASQRQGAVQPRASTVTVDLEDNGDRVALREGDRLVLILGGPSPEVTWGVARYPKSILSLEDYDKGAGRFEFLARSAGRGSVIAFNLAGANLTGCGRRLASRGTVRCPLAAGGAKVLPARPGAFHVVVEVR